jgi:hypothetical protein
MANLAVLILHVVFGVPLDGSRDVGDEAGPVKRCRARRWLMAGNWWQQGRGLDDGVWLEAAEGH